MKTIILLLFSLCFTRTVFCQLTHELMNKTWVKVLEENIDENIILYGEDVSDLYMKLVINKDTVLVFGNPDGGKAFQYKLSDTLLRMSDSSDYIIEQINDTMLVFKEGISDRDILNRKRLVFMEQNYLFNKILKSGEIEVINDSVILANKIIYPTFSVGNFQDFLNWYLPPYKAKLENGIISFSLIFAPGGHLMSCTIINNEKLSKAFAEKVRKLVAGSDGYWNLPGSSNKYYYELVMCIWFPTEEEVKLKLAWVSYFNNFCKPVSKDRYSALTGHLNEGLKLIEKGEYERSIEEFNNYLNLNPTSPEKIYYNRAYAYYKLNKIGEACSDWDLLVRKGQRYAKRLYDLHCK
jgi:hypothetical protein